MFTLFNYLLDDPQFLSMLKGELAKAKTTSLAALQNNGTVNSRPLFQEAQRIAAWVIGNMRLADKKEALAGYMERDFFVRMWEGIRSHQKRMAKSYGDMEMYTRTRGWGDDKSMDLYRDLSNDEIRREETRQKVGIDIARTSVHDKFTSLWKQRLQAQKAQNPSKKKVGRPKGSTSKKRK